MQNQPSNVPTAKPKKPRLARRVAASFNKWIEPMTSSAVMPVLQPSVSGALLVTAHPRR
jgi:hypothetical protein